MRLQASGEEVLSGSHGRKKRADGLHSGLHSGPRFGIGCASLALGFAFHLDGNYGFVVESVFSPGVLGHRLEE